MTDDELNRLQALADEATAGPWAAATTVDEYGQRLHTMDVLPLTSFGEIEPHDAAFIAASRDAIPTLIAEVRRLQEKLLTAIERTQRSVHDYYYDKIRDMTIEIEQLHDQIGRDALSYAQCDSDRRNFAARCAWMREELMDLGVTRKELDEHE